ncbi:MAG: APC family permease, partial [Terriglobia bacterium]
MNSPNPEPSPLQLRRGLRPSGLIAVTFLCVAGGAFGLEDAVGAVGPLVVLLGILILPWLWSFPTALMTAELSTAMPEDGGYVIWVERAFGRFWGFQEGWLSWMYSFADNALYPAMFLDYLAYLRGDLTPTERVFIGIAVIFVTTWLNIRGIQLVGFLSILFTLFILAPFAMMVFLGAPKVNPSHWLVTHGNVNWSLLLSVLLWNTCGWDNAGCCAGEVTNPERTYPRAMIVAVLLVTFSYLLPMAVGVGVVTNWSEWKVGMFPKIAAQVGGGWLGVWLTVAGLVSAVGMLNALLCTSSRVPFAMARHRLLPRNLSVLHPTYATPWRAILVNS